MIIDTHNHIYFPGLDTSEILEKARKTGVEKQVLIGIDELSCLRVLDLIEQHDDLYGTLGLHPCDVDKIGQRAEYQSYEQLSHYKLQCKNLDQYFDWIDQQFSQNLEKVVGFGESGFDRYHQDSPELVKAQEQSFEAHLSLCVKYQKTLIIHSRNAKDNCLRFLRQHKKHFQQINFIWHCFSEDLQTAQLVIELGGKIGLGGVITYPKSALLRTVVAKLPITSLVTETDAPFLTPHQARKKHKQNSPEFLSEIVTKIAETKGLETQKCEEILYKNGCEVFDL